MASEREYVVPVSLTIHTTATVYAESPEEAVDKVRKCDWEDDGRSVGELIDWHVRGDAEEYK